MRMTKSNGYCHDCGNDRVDILCCTAENNEVSVDLCSKCYNAMLTFVKLAFGIPKNINFVSDAEIEMDQRVREEYSDVE